MQNVGCLNHPSVGLSECGPFDLMDDVTSLTNTKLIVTPISMTLTEMDTRKLI